MTGLTVVTDQFTVCLTQVFQVYILGSVLPYVPNIFISKRNAIFLFYLKTTNNRNERYVILKRGKKPDHRDHIYDKFVKNWMMYNFF